MIPSGVRPLAARKLSFAGFNVHLDRLQADYKKNPANLRLIRFKLMGIKSELLEPAGGASSLFPKPKPKSSPSKPSVGHSSLPAQLGNSLKIRTLVKISGVDNIYDAQNKAKKEARLSGQPLWANVQDVKKVIEADLAKDEAPSKINLIFLEILVSLVCTRYCLLAILGLLVVTPFLPFILLKQGFSLVCAKMGRRPAYRSLAVYWLLLELHKKLEKPHVTNGQLADRIEKIVAAYKGLRTLSSKASLKTLGFLEDLAKDCRKNPQGFIYGTFNHTAVSAPKTRFYYIVRSYLLDPTYSLFEKGGTPKNGGKALYRILIENLAEFVDEDVQDDGQNAGFPASPSPRISLAEWNGSASDSYSLLSTDEEESPSSSANSSLKSSPEVSPR